MHEIKHPGRDGNPQSCDEPEYKNGFAKDGLKNGKETKNANRFCVNHILPIHFALSHRICNDKIGRLIVINDRWKKRKYTHEQREANAGTKDPKGTGE